MKTRSTTNKDRASESGNDSRHPQVFEKLPASPSTTAPATHLERGDAAAPACIGGETSAAPSTSYPALSASRPSEIHESGRTTRAVETSAMETASTIRTRRSYSSDVARVKKAEYEAHMRLAALRKEQLEIEKALVNKRLEYEVSVIHAEADAREETREEASLRGGEEGPEKRIDEWFQSMERDHPPVAGRLQIERTPHTTAEEVPATATYVNATAPTAHRHDQRRTRSTSCSPVRESHRAGKGIERLAETLEKMIRVRPPPPPRQITELPVFTGAATEWLPFKAAYEDSSSLYNFSAVENLARLRNCIKGEARTTVSALLYTASNPDTIMKTLEQYYGRPEILIDRVMEDLKKLPRLTGAASELNTFAVKLKNIVCVLSNMDKRGYLWNPLLVREVVEKLSPHVKTRWCDYAYEKSQCSRDPEIMLLSSFLMQEADRAMKYAFVTASTAPAPKKEMRTAAPQLNAKKKPSREAVYAMTEEKKQECLCCNGEHEVPKCPKFLKMSVNERWDWARTAKMCFKCVTRRHRREHCRAKRCGIEGCTRSHHALLHQERDTSVATAKDKEDEAASAGDSSPKEAVMTVSTANDERLRTLLKIRPVTLKGPGGEVSTFALLDEGSTTSLVDEDLARKIQLNGPTSTLRIQSITSQQREESSQLVRLQIRGEDGSYQDMRARTMRNLRLHGQSVDKSTLIGYPHLRDLQADAFFDQATPKILIGADNWHLIVTKKLRVGKKNEPAASYTELGWVIHGVAPRATLKKQEGHVVLHVFEKPRESDVNQLEDIHRVEELVKSHFKIDALGVSLSKKMKPEDKRAIDIIDRTIKRVNGNYEVGLPWRNDEAMPSNYNSALRRLKTLERKMDSSPDFAARYSAQVDNLLRKGYAKECDGTEDYSMRAWYLPHFPVVNPNKPEKVRMVFDASYRYSGVCLNDFLLEGPDLLTPLLGILFRFREHIVAVTADIQEMFLQIKIIEQDQPAQMFLWRGQERVKPPVKYKMTSMIFGASCSPFIAHTVRDANAKLYSHEYPDAVRAITTSHYMDDYVDSFATEEEAIKTAREVTKIHQNAHFNLRGWCSNKKDVVKNLTMGVPACDMEVRLGSRAENTDKTLGLLWQTNSDELGFNTGPNRVTPEVRMRNRPPTKREALGAVMSVYDPLGLISHYTIAGKVLLQNLWRNGLGWDERIPEIDAANFEDWMRSLDEVASLRIPRCYDKMPADIMDLHVFCDASEQAYATAAYWRIQRPDGQVFVRLVAARARVAPLRAVTIPRLELQAALIGARLARTIIEEHRYKPRRVTYWTDSQTVLRWIEKDAAKYTPFVAHRLGEIAELSDANQWRWVPTDLNVADDATRPIYAMHMNSSDRWFVGPSFLYRDEDTWPTEKREGDDTNEEATYATVVVQKETPSHLPDVNRFASYEKLLRATAVPLLFREKCKDRSKQMSVELIERAEYIWIRQVQLDDYAEEIRLLQKDGSIPRSSSLYKLDPTLYEGLLRVKGRIGQAAVAENQKMPVILNGRHPFTKLLVEHAHRKAGHANNERVVNELRQRFWVTHLRPTVRTVARQCQTCRIMKAIPARPPTGDLPAERLTLFQRPFTSCGVDYFGPMTVVIGRRHEKRWCALFTCLTTRAVHLELVPSLSTDSALMAIRRMAARRGWPRVMYSDNGTNFRGADVELRAAYKEWAKEFTKFGLEYRMKWKFIPPGAPHMGGAWERLVRSVKTALGATLYQRAIREEVLSTLLVEAEHAVNSRPLTHVSVDPKDPEALTPNHFLIGTSSGLPYTGPCQTDDRKLWKLTQALADHFWQRWVKEYLPTLVPRGESQSRQRCLRVGDLVVVVDPTLPRGVWPRGMVETVYAGPDGQVRSADVRTPAGTFRRPVTKLAVLPTVD